MFDITFKIKSVLELLIINLRNQSLGTETFSAFEHVPFQKTL